jgi:hypothetical protein
MILDYLKKNVLILNVILFCQSAGVSNFDDIDDPCPVCSKSYFVNVPARTYHIEQHFNEASQLSI